MINKEQFISSILYAFIGDAFGMPLDGMNPNFIRTNYPNGFASYESPMPISRNNKLAAGSISDVGATTYLTMEMLYDSPDISAFQLKKHFNRFMRYSSAKKHDFEPNYDNFDSEQFIDTPGFTNITKSLPLLLTHLNDNNLEDKLYSLSNLTHTHEDSKDYMIFHNMMLRELIKTKDLPMSIYNNLKYLSKEKDREIMYKILQEKLATGRVEMDHLEFITNTKSIDEVLYSNYPLAIAASLNNYSLIEQFLCAIYMGGATSFNCFIIGSIHGILHPDIEIADDSFLEKLHYGREIRIVDMYDLAEALYNKYYLE